MALENSSKKIKMIEKKQVEIYHLSEVESAELLRLTQRTYLTDLTGMSKEKVTLIQPDREGNRSEGILYQYKDEESTQKFVVIPLPGSSLEEFVEEFILKRR